MKLHQQLRRPFEIHSLFMSVYTSDVNKSNENIGNKDEEADNEAPLDPRIQVKFRFHNFGLLIWFHFKIEFFSSWNWSV